MFASYKHLAATRNAVMVRVRKASGLSSAVSSQQSAVSATWHRPPGRHLSLNALWFLGLSQQHHALVYVQHHTWQHAHVALCS